MCTILLLHIISVRPSKQPLMVRTFLKVYMELGSYFLFLQEQIKDIIIIMEFKRTSVQRRDYRERGGSRAMTQHDILVRSLKKVAEVAEGENVGWKIKLIIFVGSMSGSVHAQDLNVKTRAGLRPQSPS
jgi:hypothetical protein